MTLKTFLEFDTGHDNNFNLIRITAAIAVMFSHAYPISLGRGAVQPLQGFLDGTTLGTVAVLTFFSLSGFLITGSFSRGNNWRRFVRARLYRIMPALVFVLAFTVVFCGVFLTTASPSTYLPDAVAYFLRNVTLLDLQYSLTGVFEGNPFGPAINGSLWTLIYEVACYSGVLLLGILGVLHNRMAATLLLLSLVAAQVLASIYPFPHRLATMIHFSLPFAVGAWIYLHRDRVPVSLLGACLLSSVAFALAGTPFFDAALSLALAYGVLVLGVIRVPVLLRYNRLGDYSYGTYLFAFPVQQFAASQGVVSPVMNFMIALPATLVLAIISWKHIEAPCLARLRRSSGP